MAAFVPRVRSAIWRAMLKTAQEVITERNDGSSLMDAVDRLETDLGSVAERLDRGDRKFEAVDGSLREISDNAHQAQLNQARMIGLLEGLRGRDD